MSNPFEKAPERIPTKEEILAAIAHYEKRGVLFVKEKFDDIGVYFLEAKSEGKEVGEFSEYHYVRKGEFPDGNASAKTTIFVTHYKDDFPLSGVNVAEYNAETGEWKDIV